MQVFPPPPPPPPPLSSLPEKSTQQSSQKTGTPRASNLDTFGTLSGQAAQCYTDAGAIISKKATH